MQAIEVQPPPAPPTPQLEPKIETLRPYLSQAPFTAWQKFSLLDEKTFELAPKGTQDFQPSDLVIPAILTAIAVLLGWLGFSRQRRTRRDLKEATAALARELDKRPLAPSDAEQRSMWP